MRSLLFTGGDYIRSAKDSVSKEFGGRRSEERIKFKFLKLAVGPFPPIGFVQQV